jgi:hypothetical protein
MNGAQPIYPVERRRNQKIILTYQDTRKEKKIKDTLEAMDLACCLFPPLWRGKQAMSIVCRYGTVVYCIPAM